MRIKYSKRGLTFSFRENETFRAGEHYRYFIDTKNNEVIILPDVEGKYIFSKKGAQNKPLVDLRNAEIRNCISMADYMEIEVLEEKIIVHIICKKVNTENLSDVELVELLDSSEKKTFEISKEDLIEHDSALIDMLTASGIFSQKQAADINYIFDIASLFSGAGVLDYPFKQDESFDIRFAVDYDRSACKTYAENIGNHILCMDMRELKEEQVPDVDLIIGGVPCVGYSNANRAANEAANVQKRLLIDDYIRIVKSKRPLVFLVENVPQFITKEKSKYLNKVLTELSEYEITYSVVNDHEVGGYSIRKRMILIGSLIGKINIPDVVLSKRKTVRDALMKVDSTWYNYADITKPSAETQRKMSFVRPGHNYRDIPEMKGLNRHSDTYRRLSYDEPSITIVNWRKVNIMPPEGNRSLSVAEAAALTGLDKNFKFMGSLNDKQQQCGNAVPVSIARFAKTIIKNALYAFVNSKLFNNKRKVG